MRALHGNHPGRVAMLAAVVVAGICLVPAQRASAQVDADLRAGVNVDADALTIGGGLLLDLERLGGWYFNPNVEAALGENDDRLSVNGDFHYDFGTTRNTSFYAGAGPAWLSRDLNDDFGLNLLGGFAGRSGEVRPFAQFKGVIADNDEVVLMGGVRF